MSSGIDNCSSCNFNFIGDPIPKELTDKGYYGSDPKHWFLRREVGMEISGVYDGVLIWMCPNCEYMWPRFKPESGRDRLYQAAIDFIERTKNANH